MNMIMGLQVLVYIGYMKIQNNNIGGIMGLLTQEEINVDLFDEVTRLKKENKELKEQLKNKINAKEFI